MRKKLLVLAFLVTLTVSYKEDTKAASNFNASVGLFVNETSPPALTDYYPYAYPIKGTKDEGVSFRIYYDGSPEPTYKVYKETTRLYSSSKYTLTTYDNQVTVIINNLEEEDAGEYRIILENKYGEASKTFRAEVIDAT